MDRATREATHRAIGRTTVRAAGKATRRATQTAIVGAASRAVGRATGAAACRVVRLPREREGARPCVSRSTSHCSSESTGRSIVSCAFTRAGNCVVRSISTWTSTLTSTCVRRCTTSCYRTRSAHRFRSCSASSSSRRPARSGLFSTSTSTLAWPCPNYGGGIGGVRAEGVNSELRMKNLGLIVAATGMCAIKHILEFVSSRTGIHRPPRFRPEARQVLWRELHIPPQNRDRDNHRVPSAASEAATNPGATADVADDADSSKRLSTDYTDYADESRGEDRQPSRRTESESCGAGVAFAGGCRGVRSRFGCFDSWLLPSDL